MEEMEQKQASDNTEAYESKTVNKSKKHSD